MNLVEHIMLFILSFIATRITILYIILPIIRQVRALVSAVVRLVWRATAKIRVVLRKLVLRRAMVWCITFAARYLEPQSFQRSVNRVDSVERDDDNGDNRNRPGRQVRRILRLVAARFNDCGPPENTASNRLAIRRFVNRELDTIDDLRAIHRRNIAADVLHLAFIPTTDDIWRRKMINSWAVKRRQLEMAHAGPRPGVEL